MPRKKKHQRVNLRQQDRSKFDEISTTLKERSKPLSSFRLVEKCMGITQLLGVNKNPNILSPTHDIPRAQIYQSLQGKPAIFTTHRPVSHHSKLARFLHNPRKNLSCGEYTLIQAQAISGDIMCNQKIHLHDFCKKKKSSIPQLMFNWWVGGLDSWNPPMQGIVT